MNAIDLWLAGRKRIGRTTARALVTAAALAGAPAMASAASTSATFTVTATVVDACSVSATNLAFGTYNPNLPTDTAATSTLSVNCTLGTPYTVSLDSGAHALGSSRRMASGSNRLAYELYRDAAATLVFGTLAGALNVSGVGLGVAASHTVYGVIPKGQAAASGSYTDTVTVTVDY